jgi:ethanolamine ammonia-lyase small subunit
MNDVTIDDSWGQLRRFTPARIALGRTGDSLPTQALLDFGVAHAAARDAVHRALDETLLRSQLAGTTNATITVHSAAGDRTVYLRRPDLGRTLAEASRTLLADHRLANSPDLVVVVADGLSAFAPERHAVLLIEQILPLISDITVAPIVIAQQARVALGDEIGEIWGARFVAMLIGERPGLSSPDSLGVYLTYRPRRGVSDAERNCISNIRPEGLGYAMAARKFEYLLRAAQKLGATGVHLKDESDAATRLPQDQHPLPDPRGEI